MSASLKDVVEANEVALDIGIWIGDAVADACLCGEVDHHIEVILVKEFINHRFVGDVAFHKHPFIRAIRGICVQVLQPVFFQSHIIVVVHIVDTHEGRPLQICE